MNKYKRFAMTVIVINILLIIGFNIIIKADNQGMAYGQYRVDISRIVKLMEAGETIDRLNLKEYSTIIAVKEFAPDEVTKNSYTVESVNGKLYRFEYRGQKQEGRLILNILMILNLLFNIFLIFYIGKKVIKPMSDMTELAVTLAKGNLSIPIKAEKRSFLGRLVWSLDMLREKLEGDKERELELIKDRKTLILSLSHDIKTPLSAIDLYTNALLKNIYDSHEGKQAAINGIRKNTHIIKDYVNQINQAAREDFLSLQVNNSDFYINDVLDYINEYYTDKMSQKHTGFVIHAGENCLLYGDKDRTIEVLQNIIENALKDGDGKKIGIYCNEEEGCKLISVENTGCTLKPEEINYIFDSFYRGANSESVKGSGLGLYIARQLIHMMDGEIYAGIESDIFKLVVVLRKL